MSNVIPPRRKGDAYQSKFFWLKLLELKVDDHIASVTFESNEVSFVDDVVVSYGQPIKDQLTGKSIIKDLFQCKYHMKSDDAFTIDNLIEPKFINCKDSMLKRLYDAYRCLLDELGSDAFRLYIVSNWNWDHRDVLAEHIQEQEMIRDTFFERGPNSERGKARIKLRNHLDVSEEELYIFLNTIRFKLGENLTELSKDLNILLKQENLKQIDPKLTHNIYDDLSWKLLEQGRHSFDKQSLNKLILEEDLIVLPSPKHSEIFIRSFSKFTRPKHNTEVIYLDLCPLFDGRFPKDEIYWKRDIPEHVSTLMLNEDLNDIPQPIHISFDCHLSIAFLVGSLSSPKHRIEIIPTQKAELWKENEIHGDTALWKLQTHGEIREELVLAISVTHEIQKQMEHYLENKNLSNLPQISVSPFEGLGPNAISDGDHAWKLGHQLNKQLREMLPISCCKIHLFLSVPVALSYIFGYTLRHIVPIIQLYEYDYEGQRYKLRYYPSLQVPYQT